MHFLPMCTLYLQLGVYGGSHFIGCRIPGIVDTLNQSVGFHFTTFKSISCWEMTV